MKFTLPALLLTTLLLSSEAQAQVQKIKTIAGTGTAGHTGDGSVSTAAELNAPHCVTVDPTGNVYILDYLNYRIRKINTAGIIVTIAGNGGVGYSGDGSVATSAEIVPSGFVLDKHNNLYISDASWDVIRKVDNLGIISTFAGVGIQGNSGDGGPANAARFGSPYGLAIDTAGNMYVADAINHSIRKINAAGIVSKFAGDDTPGFGGDGGFAVAAQLDSPYAVAADRKGNVYISDMLNNRIRKVDAFGLISTYAGTGAYGYSGDGGPASAATLDRPAGIAVDSNGVLYIADADNDVIRMVDTDGIISTVVGNGTPGFGGDLGNVNGCNLHTPFGVALDKNGSIYIADANNQRIRKTYASVGINDVRSGSGISVSPNPTNDLLVVSGLDASDKVAIYDLTGRNVHVATGVATGGAMTLHTGSLAAGVYVLRVFDAAGVSKSVVKVVRQ
jgi:trimeric autotransporter adhesin